MYLYAHQLCSSSSPFFFPLKKYPSPQFDLSRRKTASTTMAASSDNLKPGAMPMMIYGTAWKKDKTAELVYEAIKAGFRGIDSGVGEHYNEPGVGEGLRKAFDEGVVKRSDLWIQTKVSSLDERFPDEDIQAAYPRLNPRVCRVIASALQSLVDLFPVSSSPSCVEGQEESYIDSLLLHETHAYQPHEILIMSKLLKSLDLLPRRIRSIGVCNTSIAQLKSLEGVGVIPSIVQNPFSRYGQDEFDCSVRNWCRSQNHPPSSSSSSPDSDPETQQFTASDGQKYQTSHITQEGTAKVKVAYQAFHTLTSNRQIWESAPYIEKLSILINVLKPVVWYSLLISAGVVVLNGTSTPAHMKDDIEGLKAVWAWRDALPENKEIWDRCRGVFLDAISADTDADETA